MLKILEVQPPGEGAIIFKEVENLRPSAKMNLSYSTVDVQWSPNESKLALQKETRKGGGE